MTRYCIAYDTMVQSCDEGGSITRTVVMKDWGVPVSYPNMRTAMKDLRTKYKHMRDKHNGCVENEDVGYQIILGILATQSKRSLQYVEEHVIRIILHLKESKAIYDRWQKTSRARAESKSKRTRKR